MELNRTKGLWGRILEALEAKNAPEVARKLQKTKQAAYEWRDGKAPALDTLIDIAETSNVSLSWLVLNKGPKKLATLVQSHPDVDHASGMRELLKPKRTSPSELSPELRAAIKEEVIEVLGGLLLSRKDRNLAGLLIDALRREMENRKEE